MGKTAETSKNTKPAQTVASVEDAVKLGKRKAEKKEGVAKKQRIDEKGTAKGAPAKKTPTKKAAPKKPAAKPGAESSQKATPRKSKTAPEAAAEPSTQQAATQDDAKTNVTPAVETPTPAPTQDDKYKVLSQKERNEQCAEMGLSLGRVLSKTYVSSREVRGLDMRITALEKTIKALEEGHTRSGKKEKTPIEFVCSKIGSETKFASAVYQALAEPKGKNASAYNDQLTKSVMKVVNGNVDKLKLGEAFAHAIANDEKVHGIVVKMLQEYDAEERDEETPEDRDFIDDDADMLDDDDLANDAPVPVTTGKRRRKTRAVVDMMDEDEADEAPLFPQDADEDEDAEYKDKDEDEEEDEDEDEDENEDEADDDKDDEEEEEEEEEEDAEEELTLGDDGHYRDSKGNVYDEDGELIELVDADGNPVSADPNDDSEEEEEEETETLVKGKDGKYRDSEGNVYDEEGNLLEEAAA